MLKKIITPLLVLILAFAQASISLDNHVLSKRATDVGTTALKSPQPHEDFSLSPSDVGHNFNYRNWDFGEYSHVNLDGYLVLLPSMAGASGWLWSRTMINSHEWALVVKYKLSRGKINRAMDGFAFWATTKHMIKGLALGSSTSFTGIGVFFHIDSDHKSVRRPIVTGSINSKEKEYDPTKRGMNLNDASCDYIVDFDMMLHVAFVFKRDTAFSVHIESPGQNKWIKCFSIKDTKIPEHLYLGLTAMNGKGISKMEIHSINAYFDTHVLINPQEIKPWDPKDPK